MEELYYKFDDAPNDKYKQLFEKFKEIESLEISSWKVPHILAYFCKKYYDTYKVKYKFKFNTPAPSKCFEIFQVKRLSLLLSKDPTILKEYIDWVYKNRVSKSKRRLTSISFMLVEDLINEYKLNNLFNSESSIDRSKQLSKEYIDIFIRYNYPISTYGELSFLNQMTDKPKELIEAFRDIINIGFDISILEKVI